jgi:hypothetical protein
MADDSPSDTNEISILRDQLALCASLYESEHLDRQRQAIFSALFAVTDFLKANDFPPETLLVLMRPAIALAQLQDNIVEPLFAERARGGRPKLGIDDFERAGILAAFTNAWLHIHRNEPIEQHAKLSAAARAMRGGWFGDVDRAKLKSARELVSQEARDHPAVIVAAEFGRLFSDANEMVGERKAFQAMLKFVNSAPRRSLPEIFKTHSVLESKKP